MPVILDEVGAADWMNLREPHPLCLKRLLVPAPNDLLVVRPASPLVNSVKNEGPELLEDLSLFGQWEERVPNSLKEKDALLSPLRSQLLPETEY